MDEYMRSNLEELRKAVALNWDGVLLYGGYEGDGKSTICAQNMAYLDPGFNIDRVCFNLQQVKKLMDKLPPGSAIMYDESWKTISNMNRYNNDQKKLIEMLTENRKKRLYFGMVAATFFDLNKYFVIQRARAYIHVYTHGLERGYFSFFNRKNKKKLRLKGYKEWDFDCVSPNFRGRFSKWLPYDADAYEDKKDANIKDKDETDKEVQQFKDADRIAEQTKKETVSQIMYFLTKNKLIKYGANEAVANFLGISSRTVERWKKIHVVDSKNDKNSRKIDFMTDMATNDTINLNGKRGDEDEQE
jgi:hypothetical protein